MDWKFLWYLVNGGGGGGEDGKSYYVFIVNVKKLI